ncbi:MAG: helix-turn-helix domain-containing protein [Lachnospiraceae bacterium]|nr:helix-turn-helix domain-containing protein [Lachnospiraceae bacterium]
MSGNMWMFSDQIDDEDIEFIQHEFVTYSMACDYYHLGLKPVTRMARECGSIYKIGKRVLIRRSIFEAYLRKQRRIEGEYND